MTNSEMKAKLAKDTVEAVCHCSEEDRNEWGFATVHSGKFETDVMFKIPDYDEYRLLTVLSCRTKINENTGAVDHSCPDCGHSIGHSIDFCGGFI